MEEETIVQSQNDLGSEEQIHVPSPASNTYLTVRELQYRLYCEEEQGYEVPFVTFPWERWLELQATLIQGVTRFQRAIARKDACLASLIVAEMQQVIVELQKEACAWIDPFMRKTDE